MRRHRAQLPLTDGHQITQVHIRRLCAFGLAGGGLSKSHRQGFAEAERESDHSDKGQTEHDAPEFSPSKLLRGSFSWHHFSPLPTGGVN